MARYILVADNDVTINIDFPSTSANRASERTVDFPGATPEDSFIIDAKSLITSSAIVTAFCTLNNKVTVRYHNYTNSAVNPASITFRIRMIRKDPYTEYAPKGISGDYTIVQEDTSRLLEVNTASVITVPNDSSLNLPINSIIPITQIGTGDVTIQGAPGVIIQSPENIKKIKVQFGTVSLRKRNGNTWLLDGNL